VISLTPDHYAVDVPQVFVYFTVRDNTTINQDFQMWKFPL
jgi:hypothetical protein